MMHQSPEDAFEMEPKDQIVFRVLDGVQRGAEMSLQPRVYVVGQGDDADIVLSERTLMAHHCALHVESDTPEVEAIEGSVQLGDRRIAKGARETLALPAAIRLGDVVIALGYGTTDWAGIAAPAPLTEDAGAKEAEEAPEDADAPEERAPATADVGSTENAPAALAPSTRSGPSGNVRIVVGAALLLAVGGATVAFLSEFGGDEVVAVSGPKAETGAISTIRDIIADLGYDDLTVADEPSVGPTIRGYLETDAEHRALGAALASAELQVTDLTRTSEQLVASVQTTLDAVRWPEEGFGEHLAVRSLGGGAVEIDGFLGPSVDRSALRRRIMGDVPSISSLYFVRADLRTWREDLAKRIEAAGLSQWLSATASAGSIRVDGELSPSQVVRWRAVGEAFVADSGGRPKIVSNVTAAVAATTSPAAPNPAPAAEPPPRPTVQRPQRPDLKLVGTVIASDGERWAVLADGRHVRPGDRLHEGATVTTIDTARLVIELGGKIFIYRIREN